MKQEFNSDQACVRAYSMVCASLSHDLNNTLAIINENAGLVEDLAGMSRHDYILQADDILPSTSSIIKQVKRAKAITTSLNQFAHSNDSVLSTVGIDEVFSFVETLLNRQLAQNEIRLEIHFPQGLMLTVNLLKIYSLIYLLLRSLIEAATESKTLSITVDSSDSWVTVVVEGEALFDEGLLLSESAEIDALVHGLEGKLSVEGKVTLLLPQQNLTVGL